MLNVSDATKKAYVNGAVQKSLVISFPNANVTITNDDIVQDSLEIKEAIESGKTLSYKGCISSQLKFQVADIVQDLRDQYVEVLLQAGSEDVIPIFSGYIFDQSNQTHEDVVTQFVAYDILYKTNQRDITSWYNGLTFPITVKNFRDSLFSYLGITQETVTLVNDALSISKTITDKAVNAGDVLKALCQINARFGQIGRDGKFYYRRLSHIEEALYPALDLYPSPDLYPSRENANEIFNKADYRKITYEPFQTEVAGKVVIYNQSGAVGGSSGSGTNEFSITDNPLAYGLNNMNDACDNIMSEMGTIQFIPAKIDVLGLPWIECGDIVMVNTMKNVVRTYVLSRTLKGIQSLFDTYVSSNDQFFPKHKQSLRTSVSANKKDIDDNTLQIGTVRADLIQTNTIVAQKASISDLNAVSARVGSLEADHVTTSQLNAVSASVGTLSGELATFEQATVNSFTATNASISSLSAIAITTQNLSAQTISASNVRGGNLTGVKLNGLDMNWTWIDIQGFSGYVLAGYYE